MGGFTTWKMLCRLNKMKTKYMLEEHKSFSILSLLISISSSWENNFWRISTTISVCYCTTREKFWVLTLHSTGHSQKVSDNRLIYTSILVQRKTEPWKSTFWLSPPIALWVSTWNCLGDCKIDSSGVKWNQKLCFSKVF